MKSENKKVFRSVLTIVKSDGNKCGYKYENCNRRPVIFGVSFSVVKLKESVAIDRTAFTVFKRKEMSGSIRHGGLY
jgi:hypothetical protein